MKELNRREFIKSTTATTAGVATIASGITLTTFAADFEELHSPFII